MAVLVVGEIQNNALASATLSVVTAAKAFNTDIALLLASDDCSQLNSSIDGINKIIHVEHPDFAHPTAEALADLVMGFADQYQLILAPASTFGKNFMPRVAAKLFVPMISDVIEIVDVNTFVRPIYAGNALSYVQSLDQQKVLTIRSTAFSPAPESQSPVDIETYAWEGLSHPKSRFVKIEASNSDRPDLTSAKIVISGGRGLQSAENFQIIEKLADRLGAAVGATRAVVDAGFVPNDYQVGQTGKVVAPDLYIAIGISGAIQHIAGIKDSKVIIAINKDPDAPIFDVADYGLVADFFDILPEFEAALAELGY